MRPGKVADPEMISSQGCDAAPAVAAAGPAQNDVHWTCTIATYEGRTACFGVDHIAHFQSLSPILSDMDSDDCIPFAVAFEMIAVVMRPDTCACAFPGAMWEDPRTGT